MDSSGLLWETGKEMERERERERELYARLLDEVDCDGVGDLMEEGLAVAMARAQARRGYLELTDQGSDEPFFWAASGCTNEDLHSLRAELSRRIAASAVGTGEVVLCTAAYRDPRFSACSSVRDNRIRAVLCAPIVGATFEGVLYLQGRRDPGPFRKDDVALVTRLARSFATLADRVGPGTLGRDPATRHRKALDADELVGRSGALAETLRLAAIVAPFPTVHVMLHGPSGVGKSRLAEAIHRGGPRRDGPLVVAPCGALADTLIEAELFGCVAGAYTGATLRRGLLRSAHGGTVVLDDVATLPLPSQASLLRFLQRRKLRPVGSDEEVDVDVRVIATTNVDLEEQVEQGRFRADLYHRLTMFPIAVPSLGERRSDIPIIARALVRRITDEHLDGRSMVLTTQAVAALARRAWPGNVRELDHTLLRAVLGAVAEGETRVTMAHLPAGRRAGDGHQPSYRTARRMWLAAMLEDRLESCGHNVSAMARSLEISRSRAYELMELANVER